jgi:hypothetical protein
LTPSATLSCAKMKYTFMGYVNNGEGTPIGSTLRIKRAGSEIWRTVVVPEGGSQQSFCVVWYDTYTANQTITATAEAASNQNLNYYILICEAVAY